MDARTARAAARRAHEALVHALADLERAEKHAVLRFADVVRGHHYKPLGFGSPRQYAMEALGFSASKATQFLRLAGDLERLPGLEAALEAGQLEWTKAREVGKVAAPDTAEVWIQRAQQSSRRDFERDVRKVRERAKQRHGARRGADSTVDAPSLLDAEPTNVNPGSGATPRPDPGPPLPEADPPMRVSLALTGLQYAEFQRLLETLHRRGSASRAELVLEALRQLAAAPASTRPAARTEEGTRVPSRPPVQVVAYRCESCAGVAVPTPTGMRRLQSAEAAAAVCDSVETDPAGRRRSRTPAKLRREVLARDRHRCRRCGRIQFVDVHHLHRRSEGGADTLRNCVALCRACHVAWHQEEAAGSPRSLPTIPGT